MSALRPTVSVRYIEPRDITEILEVERASFVHPWTKDDFVNCMKRNNTTGVVAEINGVLMGFLIFEVFKRRIQLLNLAVRPRFRRMGIGSTMIGRVICALGNSTQKLVAAEVRESNLGVQLFLKSLGFRADQILPEYYSDTGEDGYQFEFWLANSLARLPCNLP